MNNTGKQRVAQILAAGLTAEQIRVGDSSVAPEPTQTGLQGTQVGAGSGVLTANGATIEFITAVPLGDGEIVGEAGLFDDEGRMLDRWVFGPLATGAAGSLVPIWTLEVL